MNPELTFDFEAECSVAGTRLYRAESHFGTFEITCDRSGRDAELDVPVLEDTLHFDWLSEAAWIGEKIHMAMVAAYNIGQKGLATNGDGQ